MRKLLLIIFILLTLASVFVIARFQSSLRGVFDEAIHPLLDRHARAKGPPSGLAMTALKLGNKPLKVLILLGNDQEIRTNMGFPGSYATFTTNIKYPISDIKFNNLAFHDIYTPTGQIQGHVEPPKPIQEAFQQGEWLLPNFDFSPDFPTSAKSFRWFMEKAGEEKFDLLVTLNLSTVRKVLDFVGTDSRQSIADLQAKTEVNFFPGSTQKKDALELVGKDLLKKITALSNDDKMKIAKIILDDLDNGNILLNSSDDSLQTLFNKSNWTGDFPISNIKYPISNDFFMMIENNYGANKANCCIVRKTIHTITDTPPQSPSTLEGEVPSPKVGEGQGGVFNKVGETARSAKGVHHQVTISFTNTSPLENPDPPRFYGGNYLSYIRFYIPDSATNIKVVDHSNEVPKNTRYPSLGEISNIKYQISNVREVSLFHLTRAGSSSSIELAYDLNIPYQIYNLTLFKQSGLPSSPQEINLFGKTYTTNLEKSQIFSAVIPSETK